MLILAIDTALDACAAAVLDTEAGALIAHESLAMARGHAEALMPLVARVMETAQVPFEMLDRIAVTTGPGSFTGLRVGISAARGIALAASRPAVGVTTLSSFAAPMLRGNGQAPIVSAIDARHDHVYVQIVSGDGAVLQPPGILPIAQAIALHDLKSPHLVGNAAKLLAARWPASVPSPASVVSSAAPDIGWVAWLGAAVKPGSGPPRPYYLKAPDAKPSASAAEAHPAP